MLIRYNEWLSDIVILLFVLHIPLLFLLAPDISIMLLIIFGVIEMIIPLMLLKRFIVGRVLASLLLITYILIGIYKLLYGLYDNTTFYSYVFLTIYIFPAILLVLMKYNTKIEDVNYIIPDQYKINLWFRLAPYILLSVQLIVSLLIILVSRDIDITLIQIYITFISLYLFSKLKEFNLTAIRIILLLPFCILWGLILFIVVTILYSNSVTWILLATFNVSIVVFPIIILSIFSIPYYFIYKKKMLKINDETFNNDET